eukprot:scaffold15497_cov117-Cylindrotheca_fusiformis.AAC.4
MSYARRRLIYAMGSTQRFASKAETLIPRIRSIPKDHPFFVQLAIATGKTSAADIMIQTAVEKKKLSEIDFRRNAIFLIFGLTYLGGFQWWLLINKYKQWFPTMERFGEKGLSQMLRDRAGLKDAAKVRPTTVHDLSCFDDILLFIHSSSILAYPKMVIFDVAIHSPFMYFPSYYTVKEIVGSSTWNPLVWVSDGLSKYRKNMKEDLTAMALVTIPSDCVQMAIPIHMRMPFRHLISFFWTGYISFSRGKFDEVEEEESNKVSSSDQVTATKLEER